MTRCCPYISFVLKHFSRYVGAWLCIHRCTRANLSISLRSGKFPSDWKVARVIPIPKGGDPESPANYRPISILSILSKLLKKHLHDLLSHHLNIFSPLSEHQWGFTSGKSTTSALISYAHDCQEALDCGNELCSVFFDLSKAFDTVPHQQLLFKLFELQVDPFLIRWVSNYLTDRTQSVVLGGVQSNLLPVVSGVPRGSVLGPLLFLIYQWCLSLYNRQQDHPIC